jgi:hypothetical protein
MAPVERSGFDRGDLFNRNPMTKIENGTVSITRDGVEYLGFFAIFDNAITVTYGASQKTTQFGGSATMPESLAMVLLSELVTEHLASLKQ